eukprot:6181207-Pleurochrysis_carterae.AAC.3
MRDRVHASQRRGSDGILCVRALLSANVLRCVHKHPLCSRLLTPSETVSRIRAAQLPHALRSEQLSLTARACGASQDTLVG